MSVRINLPGMPDYEETKKAVEAYEPVQVLGTQKVAGKEFTAIEGGFGEGKKAMLVKDIAEIHGRDVFKVNELINNNRSRFKDDVDIVDFLNPSKGYRDFAKENGWVGSNRTKNVFLLSERGYVKLLKIMEDDLAWELYDEFVDKYFNMRAEQKEEPKSYAEMFFLASQAMLNVEAKQKELEQKIINQDAKVESIKEVVALNLTNWRKDSANLIIAIAQVMGGHEHIQHIRRESYRLLEERAGCKLSIRLTNKRQRMADEGVSKSKRDKLSKLDVIADDKKLIEICVAIIKDMAIKNGVGGVSD